MKARVKTSITIHASTSQVFKYLADTKLHFVWNAHLEKVKPQGKLHAGAAYETLNIVLRVRVRAQNHVSIFVENTELEIINQTGLLHYRVNYKLTEKSKSDTELVCTTVVEAQGNAFYFARPMLQQLARRELRIDLRALKLAVEQKLS